MLSLTLGLIITAAAILLFLASQRSLSMQQGVSDIQDNANFGLNFITRDLRLINLNNPESIITDQTAYSGVVLTSSINAKKDTTTTPATLLSNLNQTIVGTSANVNLLSRSNGMTAGNAPMWTGASNVQIAGADILSDQLVIQYLPPYVVDQKGTPTNEDDDIFIGGFDCEGNKLDFAVKQNSAKPTEPFGQQMVVQRYFLRVDANAGTNEPNQPLVLACDAGFYPATGSPAEITNYGDAGEIIMKRVDHLRVLLGVQNANNTRRYISVNDYLNLPVPHPRIVSIQMGLLTRSAQTVGVDNTIKNDQDFTVLDQTIKVKATQNTTKYVRQVISQTVALRNAIGERGK